MKGVPDEKRTARFVCAVAACVPGWYGKGCARKLWKDGLRMRLPVTMDLAMIRFSICRNMAVLQQRLSPEDKNAISHRGKALRAMRVVIEAKE